MTDSDVTQHFEDESISAFCVSCRSNVEMENPVPVWTSQGRPGVRGICPECGTTVYRMGKTSAHDELEQPEAIQVVDQTGLDRKSRAAKIKVEAATYIAAAATESDFAEKLSADLNAVGISTWVDNGEETDNVNWASGVHPALEQCKKLVIVLSDFALKTNSVEEAWQHFLKKRKPILIALVEDVDPPDALRRRPRYLMYEDYKRAFRQMVQELSQ